MRRGLSLLACVLGLVLGMALPARAQTVCAPAVLSGVTINEETAGFVIRVEYPVLCSAWETRIIRDHVTRSLSEFKMDFPDHDLSDFRHKYEMMTDYAVWPAGGGRFASVKLQVMVYTGGAHPNNWPETWVFDMVDGRELTLDDVFINVPAALAEVAPMVRSVLTDSLGQMAMGSMMDSGTTPVAGNYDDFILTEEGVVFFFAPYQVAPYAAGQQVVTVPYERLDKVLEPGLKMAVGR